MMNYRDITSQYLTHIYPNLREVHEDVFRHYEEAKSKKLFNLFQNNLILEKEVEYTQSHSSLCAYVDELGIIGEIQDGVIEYYKEKLFNYIHFNAGTPQEERNTHFIFRRLISYSSIIDNKVTIILRPDEEFYSPVQKKIVKVPTGTIKLTKLLRHFIEDERILEDIRIDISRVVGLKTTKGTLCISIHPMDYLTTSVNNCDWTSCFRTYPTLGEYAIATSVLMNSPCTIIAYLKSSKDMTIGAGELAPVWNSKRWRAYLTVSEDNEVCHVGRQYPYDNTDLATEAVKMVAALTGKEYGELEDNEYPSGWDEDYDDYVEREFKLWLNTPGYFYNDIDENYTQIARTKDARDFYDLELSNQGSTCIKCGREHWNEEGLVCGNCEEKCPHISNYF